MRLVVVVALALVGCQPYTEGVQRNGQWVYLPIADAMAALPDALREQVADELACPSLTITRVEGDYLVAGCDRRVLYHEVLCQTGRPEARFVPISIPITEPAPFATPGCTGAEVVALAAASSALDAAGARDLLCPREDVIPTFVSVYRSWPLPTAEGCGKRATYFGGPPVTRAADLRLMSVVDVRP